MDENILKIEKFLKDRGWDNLKPSDLAKSISIEAAELLEIFQWDSLTVEQTKSDAGKMREIRAELADVLIYCLQMAYFLNLSPQEIIKEKMEHNANKYPAQLIKTAKRNNLGDTVYAKIKKEYRRKK